MFDIDQFEERAAIHEYDGGMTRFQAETLAAKAQGKTRWEALNEIRMGHSAAARDQRAEGKRDAANDLPRMQRHAEEQNRSVPVGDVQAGRDRLALLALRA